MLCQPFAIPGGNTFRDSHSVDKKSFIANAHVGFVIAYDNFGFSIAQKFISKQFDEQDESYYYFGSIGFSFLL